MRAMNESFERGPAIPSWVQPPEEVRLNPDEVHIWVADQAGGTVDLSALARALSEKERARAERFHFDEHRSRFIVRRWFLRSVLGAYLGVEPDVLDIYTDSYGKPHVRSKPLITFNLSHSGDLALLAVAAGKAVGVDIERVAGRVNGEAIARRFFSKREVGSFLALPLESRENAFFNCWTRKEAYVKARGQGLSLPLDRFSVSLAPGEPAALLQCDEGPVGLSRWLLADLPGIPGYAAALAVETPVRRILLWHWSSDGLDRRG